MLQKTLYSDLNFHHISASSNRLRLTPFIRELSWLMTQFEKAEILQNEISNLRFLFWSTFHDLWINLVACIWQMWSLTLLLVLLMCSLSPGSYCTPGTIPVRMLMTNTPRRNPNQHYHNEVPEWVGQNISSP